MRVTYLVNQYPYVSHSFIRREILALEKLGLVVQRVSIRSTPADLPDPADAAEQQGTRAILGAGITGLLEGLLVAALLQPVKLVCVVGQAFRLGWHSDRGILRHLVWVAEACVLLRWLRRDGVDHVHAHFGTNSATVAMFCRWLGGPSYSFTVHGPEEFDRVGGLYLNEKIAACSFVVAISDFTRSQLMRWCGPLMWVKIRVVRCGLDSSLLNGDTTPVPDTKRLVCVGRLCEQKGQILLVEALAHLRAEGIEAQLVLVGDGPMRGQIEHTIAQHRMIDHVLITGWASGEKVRETIKSSRALVLPSFAEGLPVVLMEALALGRPVISTYVAGIPELVEPGVNGWLVPAGSVDALVQAMKEALETPLEKLQDMGREGAAAVAQRHNINVEAARLADLFVASLHASPQQTAADAASKVSQSTAV